MSNELELGNKGDWWENRNKNAVLALIFVVMLAAKLLTMMLPAKYFYDNNRIVGMVNEDMSMEAWGGSYVVAANFFRAINIFGFTSISQWSWFLGMLLTLVVFFMVLRLPELDMVQTIFLLACVGLLNIYVFNIGKDAIQFLFFMAVYLVLLMPIKSSAVKIACAAIILYFESKVFRSYYVLIAALVLAIYCILAVFRRNHRLPPAVKIVITTVTMYLLVCVMMVVASVAMHSEYEQIMGIRDYSLSSREGDVDSVTIIKNWVGGDNSTNLPLFLLNYLINAVRMMIPFELAIKGVQYLPFFCFQVAVTVYLAHLFGKLDEIEDETQFLAISIFLGYVLASALFEPDFGSWVRHEAATFPVLHLLVFSRNQQLAQWKRDVDRIKGRIGRHANVVGKMEA
ncbi:hypothetical protein [Bifidobacterium moukalabense]|uniref:Membrane protein n=1 Tax=Bifidobacterium moukalabense DSM 27321 TaxID=1435051 RepID=W4NAC4_9BIFI|nr:hypothetical protein [Bifidobacterium moukalabense]ETY71974.1 membrane protein [Bifidobacterium moukalabense DSM 27321]